MDDSPTATAIRNVNEDAPWSAEDIDDLRHEISRGESVRYIADYLCRRPEEVIAIALQLGLPLKYF
jgi:hypothetical protein